MKIPYSQLQSYFNEQLPSVEEVARIFTFGAFEIESVDSCPDGDFVIDVKVLPNRASDCLSWIGIAREYAALANTPLKEDAFNLPVPRYETKGTHISITTDAVSLVPVHTLSYITGVQVKPSPAWLVTVLEKCGQRSINNVVDATNYVMLAYGQPTHAFDAQKLHVANDVRGIRIRSAVAGETMSILGGKAYTLDASMLVLADIHTNAVLDVAGVKGGAQAELTDATVDLVVSAAKFDPTSIRKTAQKLSLRTDASKRFENNIPFNLPFYGQKRVQDLIVELAGGTIVETIQVSGDQEIKKPVSVSAQTLTGVLGQAIPTDEIAAVLTRLELSPIVSDTITITPPWWRTDMLIPDDIIEEVGRVYGYDRIPATPLPEGRTIPERNVLRNAADAIRNILAQHDFVEIKTYSLVGSGEVTLANALTEDKNALRSNLSENMKDALKQNEYHAPTAGEYGMLKLFEIGKVFTATGEKTHVCIGVHPLSGKKREERANAELLTAKSMIESTLAIHVNHRIDASTLEFDLDLAVQGVDIPEQPLAVACATKYKPLALFPTALRDVAFWTPEGASSDQSMYRASIVSAGGQLLERCDLFDSFSKDGKHSFAFHLVFQSYEKTLTEEDLNPIMSAVYTALTDSGCTIR